LKELSKTEEEKAWSGETGLDSRKCPKCGFIAIWFPQDPASYVCLACFHRFVIVKKEEKEPETIQVKL